MDKYIPPFEISNEMLKKVSDIMEKIGKLDSFSNLDKTPYLRKQTKINSVHSSVAIENNPLSLEQVKDVINGKLVVGEQKDIQEVKQLQNKKNKNYNDLLQEFENSEETVIEVDSNDSIKSEIKDILTYLNIPLKDINKILSSKKNQKNLEQVKTNILTAQNYIEKKQKNNNEEECNNTAIVLASIKNNWNNINIEEETETEEDKTQDNLQKAKDYIKTIKDKTFKKISENLLKNFGADTYFGWISNLKFVAIINSTLILSCTNSFIIDTIKKDYLYGVYRTEQDGSITWLRKGIKEVVEETEKGIKSVEIVKVEK